MTHHTYRTDTLVFSSTDIGESHRYLELLTEEVGFVRAIARNVRSEKSKLRYSLQNFSHTSISLVQGKNIWRVTGAIEHYSAYAKLTFRNEHVKLLGRVTQLVRRLVQGEEKNDYLYYTMSNFFDTLSRRNLTREESQGLECIVVLRILYSLGYLGEESVFERLFEGATFEAPLLQEGFNLRRRAIQEINRSIKASQL